MRVRAWCLLTLAAVLSGTLVAGCGGGQTPTATDTGHADQAGGTKKEEIVIAVLPKLVNIKYFAACRRGAQKAADELGVTLIYDGPTEPSGSEQNKFIETWIRQGVDAICIAPNQPKTVKRFVQKAQQRGIKVICWDTDSPDCGRSLMVNQVDDQELGESLIDEIARQMNEEGKWAIAIASLDAANLNTWRRFAEAKAKTAYPKMELVDTVVTQENVEVARQKVETLLNKHPDLKGIIAFDSNSVPGAAEALKRTGRVGQVALTGNSMPEEMRAYIKDDVLEAFYLWDPRALGELTVRVAHALVDGKPIASGTELQGYGPVRLSNNDKTMLILSDPLRFDAGNIDEYDFSD
tara:strand:+ start:123 stop:1175 length:1053 start_codon:yes stop_codon:yes gene_type:complete